MIKYIIYYKRNVMDNKQIRTVMIIYYIIIYHQINIMDNILLKEYNG